nr:MAG TPA: hypothetical protein [Caudoviricetes sp.]
MILVLLIVLSIQLTSIQCLLNIHIPLPKTGKAIFAI